MRVGPFQVLFAKDTVAEGTHEPLQCIVKCFLFVGRMPETQSTDPSFCLTATFGTPRTVPGRSITLILKLAMGSRAGPPSW